MPPVNTAPRGRIYVAKDSFAHYDNGKSEIIEAGQRVREGHPVLKNREHLFKLDDSILEVPGK